MAKRRKNSESGPFVRWVRRHSPSREELARNRFIKPFASRIMHSHLWRFSRRSVPRGAALGMIVGIFVMIPGLQIIASALLALPFRANIPVAAAATFASNPITTPFILIAAVFVGNDVFGLHANPAHFRVMYENGASASQWLAWLATDAAPALVGGLLVIAVISAAISYLAASWFWRYRVGRRWKKRHRELAH
ncbi:DUF2062 domain-containing protein [Parasphingopyxis marina]|uniref:DUF2062 domain-containing protein n=1 Tax=Parasphingopyxis marina TaxID=2761622 RepID=A0A842HZR6_9SPHN|nr:DUF2062 domain-containing protein [Parasphingopyxis marina]MBC2777869.1 DUF2062 domain-containing protein [Parasphingopyxis marina]